MPAVEVNLVRVRRKRKHPLRLIFRIALGTALAAGLMYLLLSAFTNTGSSSARTPAIPDDVAPIQFK